MDQRVPTAEAASKAPEIRRITGTFGAEVPNVDVTRFGSPDGAWMRELIREHKVIVLRDQKMLSPHALATFARLLGEIADDPHHIHGQAEDEPGVKILTMDVDFAPEKPLDSWHTDGSAHDKRGYLSILQAIDVPDYGRDTVFADMEAAYDYLSPPMKSFLDGLVGLHSWGSAKPNAPDIEHPVVLTDSKNGRKSLYVNQRYTRAIKGLRRDESEALLKFLCSQVRFAELQLRVSWRPGTIVLWDNQKTQHGIIFDRPYRRVMHRVWVYA
jgi:taurine dioxygenase